MTGGLPTSRLGDVAAFVRGITFKPSDVVPLGAPESVACLRTKNVQAEIDLEDVLAVPTRFASSPAKLLRRGDILVSTANSWNLVGKCSWVPELPWKATLGGFIAALRADPSRIEPRYLYHWFSTPIVQARVRNCARQTTNIANLSFDQCLNLVLPLPPIDEQRRIAAILDQADALRRKRRVALSKCSMLSSNIFLTMFGDWSAPDSQIETVQLGQLLEFLTSGSRGWAEYYRDSGALFIRIQNVRRDELDLRDQTFVEAPITAEALRTRVQPGDVLLSITADLGRTAVVPNDIGEAYINQHLAILRTTQLSPRFLSAALASVAGQKAIQRQNKEGVKAGLNFTDIRSLRVPIVPRELQEAFSSRVDQVDLQVAAQSRHLCRLDTLFASLQHRAFRGEL